MALIETTSVYLVDEELVLLHEKCSDKIQIEVDKAIERIKTKKTLNGLPKNYSSFVAKAVEVANTKGILRYEYCNISYCSVCGETAGYAKYSRDSKYHRKGSPNYDKPTYFHGIELDGGFVRTAGYARCGCCKKCWDEVKPYLAKAVIDLKAQISKEITGEESKWIKKDNVVCTVCGWYGHKGEMGLGRTFLGDGHYPAVCPKCGVKNEVFSSDKIKRNDGFTMVSVAELKKKAEDEIAKAVKEKELRAKKTISVQKHHKEDSLGFTALDEDDDW